MITKLQKWGNSQGVRLSKELLAEVDLAVGDAVDVSAADGMLVVTPVRRVRGARDLADVLGRFSADHEAAELDWGPPAGREVW